MREIRYTLYREGGISRYNAVQGGSQGEDNVTTVIFEFDDALASRISELSESGEIYYRIKAIDGGGAVYSSDHLITTVNTNGKTEIQYAITDELTAAGGTISLFLIITQLIEGASDKVWYSFPAKLILQPTDLDKDMGELRSIDEALVAAKAARDAAEVYRDEAAASADNAANSEAAAESTEGRVQALAEEVASDKSDVDNAYSLILQKAIEISQNASNAKTSETNAANSEAAAKTSAEAAATSENYAKLWNEAAENAATLADESRITAVNSEAGAKASAEAAATSEENAAESAAKAEEVLASKADTEYVDKELINKVGLVEGYPVGEGVIPSVNYDETRGYYLMPAANANGIPGLSGDYNKDECFLAATILDDGGIVLGNGDAKGNYIKTSEFAPEYITNTTTSEEVSILSFSPYRMTNWITIYLEIPEATAKEALVVLLDGAHAGYIANGLNTSKSYVRFSLRWNGRRWENYAVAGASAATGGNVYSTTVYNASEMYPTTIKIQGTSGGIFPVGTKCIIYAGIRGE